MVHVCHRCHRRQPACVGPCACLADPAKRDIVAMATAGECPLNYFKNPPPAATPTQAVPRNQWPLTIAAIARHATEADKGIGDTVKRLWEDGTLHQRMQAAGVIVGQRGTPDTLKAIYAMLTGVDCGCADVQKRLNQLYPY